MIKVRAKFELEFVDRLQIADGFHIGAKMQYIHFVCTYGFHPNNDDTTAMDCEHPWPAIPNSSLKYASVTIFFQVRVSPAPVQDAVDVQLSLNDLCGDGTLQSMAQHQPLDTVDLAKTFDRFFHAISSFGSKEMSVSTQHPPSFGTEL